MKINNKDSTAEENVLAPLPKFYLNIVPAYQKLE